MVELSDELIQISRVIPQVPRLLSPKECKTSFEKSPSQQGLEITSIVSANLSSSFPLASKIKISRVGVVFAATSCCASGVNNALSGILNYLEESGVFFELFGFLGGPSSETLIEIKTSSEMEGYRNLGGTELLGYDSFQEVDFEKFKSVCKINNLNALAIIAASDEIKQSREFALRLSKTDSLTVTIIPQSRNQHVFIPNGIASTSLGFDSARRILAELAGNIAVDCLSSKKYWHFINCGDASLVAEVGLLIRANLIITEADPSRKIKDWVQETVALIKNRVSHGIRSGVVMISQCAFSRTAEMIRLREEISRIDPITKSVARKMLTAESLSLLNKLPKEIKFDLLKKKDASGSPKLSYFSPEEFLVEEIKSVLIAPPETKREITFRTHFLAHESRCPVPTAFDCVLGSCLGRAAACMLVNEVPNQLVTMQDLHKPVAEWKPSGLNLACLPPDVIEQKGYQLTSAVGSVLDQVKEKWKMESRYRSFGPLQTSPSIIVDSKFLPLTVMGENQVFDLVHYLDGDGNCVVDEERLMKSRTFDKVSPPILLPLRSVSDMSPLEQQRRLYSPSIPAYLSEPYLCIDSDICARVCAREDILAAAFPNSAKILPVQIVNTASVQENLNALHKPYLNVKPALLADVSDESGSDGDCPSPSARIEAKINKPLLERFVENPLSMDNIMSPKISRRSEPPSSSQLVRASDVCWQFDIMTDNRLVSIESAESSEGSKKRTGGAKKALKLGIVFFCSQVPGCHTVVSGLWDYLNEESELIGFLGGSTGLKNAWFHPLTHDLVDRYRNQGGQDLLGHFGESLVSESDFDAAIHTIETLNLDGLVIVGNLEGQLAAAILTEKLLSSPGSIKTKIISVPVSAENEIPFIRQSVGNDTVTRVFSTAISNLWTECHSSRHRWYFVRLMSHHVSHLALECALATHPNIVLVTEEIAARKQSLMAVTDMIVDCMMARSQQGKDYGIVLIPDGVVAAIPEIRRLLRELDQIVTGSRRLTPAMNFSVKLELVQAQLSRFSSVIFIQLPRFVQHHLINGALRHSETGKIDIANVAIERILQSFVSAELEKRTNGSKVEILVHSLAHQGRSSLPSNFDCDLAYTCGYTAGILVDSDRTGLVTNIDYHKAGKEYIWNVGGFPLVALVHLNNVAEKEIEARIEPTTLVMSGSGCRALFDGSIPRPPFREGRQAGPYQYISESTWHLSQGNNEAWEAFGQIAKDCRSILSGVGMELGRNSSVIESVVQSLENILNSEIIKAELRKREHVIPEEGSGNILSTCAPKRFIPIKTNG